MELLNGVKAFNILMIVIDALRRNVLSIYGGDVRVKSISYLASKGVVFENAYSVTNATDSSLTSMLSGLYPTTHGVVQHGERVRPEHLHYLGYVTFLQEILRSRGFTTIAIDFLGRWHRRGFNYYITPQEHIKFLSNVKDLIKMVIPDKVKPLVKKVYATLIRKRQVLAIPYSAEQATSYAIEVLSKVLSQKKNFFMLIHYWDTHFPYNVPRNFIEELPRSVRVNKCLKTVNDLRSKIRGYWFDMLSKYLDDECLESAKARYYASAIYVGTQIDRLIEFLDAYGALENTIIIITSDHGESLGEHDIWFDHHGLYEPSISVPLTMYIPGINHRRIKGYIQHVDLMSFLLKLLGLDYNYRLLDGVDVYEELTKSSNILTTRRFVYAEEAYTERKFTIRIGRYKLIMALNNEDAICRYCGKVHGGVKELYDLEKDPLEEHNLVDEKSDIVKELEEELIAIRNEMLVKRMRMKIERIKSNLTIERGKVGACL